MTAVDQDPVPDPVLKLCLLGPLTVEVDGEPVAVGGPRQMAVLARLMLTPDQMVTMGQLVESVWDGDEPAQPHIAIRSYVSNLRRAIEPNRRRRAADSCLASAPPGYRLAIDAHSVDWVRFENLVNQGRVELEAGRHGLSVLKIRAALELWKGDPCSGLPESHTFLAHRGRLIKLRETAIELLFDALLRQGDHPTVAAEVEAAIDENPLRERLTELGMMAFYRAGRQSEALALGQQLRTRLLEELGINPSPSIEAMELKILNHDQSLAPELEPPVMPTERVSLTTQGPVPDGPMPELGALPTSVSRSSKPTARIGRKAATEAYNAPASADGDEDHGAPLRLVKPRSTPQAEDLNLRGGNRSPDVDLLSAPPAPFGRRAELRALESIGERLAAGTSATAIITGEQGIGKTTLVRSVAATLTDQGATVAWSRCLPEQLAPLWSVAQAVLTLIDPGDDDQKLDVTPDLFPLAGLGPSVAGVLSAPTDVPYESSEILLAVTRLLKRLAERSPVVLIFEDLQWADPKTVSALHYAASTLAELPIGFVLTWRETDVATESPATNLRELARLNPLIRVELEGLDDRAIVDMASAVGRPLSAEETEHVHQRCDGNPLFVKEVLAHPDLMPAKGRRRSTLIDVVLDRVERLHDDARSILAAAALSRRPFTPDLLTQLCDRGADVVQQVLGRAVRGGVLDEVERPDGAFRFHHPVVAEVLAAELLSVDRSAMHRSAGHRLLSEDGPSFEVAHHLSKSPEPADRLQAARIAIDLLDESAPDPKTLIDADEYVHGAETVMTEWPDLRAGPWRDALSIDIGCYRSWRAWIDGRPDGWEQHAAAALRLALESLNRPPSARSAGDSVDLDRCLGAAAMTMAGKLRYPIGPTRTGTFAKLAPETQELLNEAIERLPNDQVARWVVQIFLQARAADAKPGPAGQRKAVREAAKLLGAARKKLSPADMAQVIGTHLTEFSDTIEPQVRLQLIDEMLDLDPGLPSRLLEVRVGYPTMLDLGRSLDAELMTRKLLDDCLDAEVGVFEATEAQVLMARHLLWTGQLDAADDVISETLTRWQGCGFGEPVTLVRQLRAVRLLRRTPLSAGHGPDEHHQLLAERASSPELSFRLARLGDITRAGQCLDRMLEFVGARQISLSDQAFIAMAAGLVGHEKAALMVLDMLKQSADQPIARADGSVIFGPASLYASLAASAAGRAQEAARHLEAAAAAIQRFGGSPASLHVVTSGLVSSEDSNQDPTNS